MTTWSSSFIILCTPRVFFNLCMYVVVHSNSNVFSFICRYVLEIVNSCVSTVFLWVLYLFSLKSSYCSNVKYNSIVTIYHKTNSVTLKKRDRHTKAWKKKHKNAKQKRLLVTWNFCILRHVEMYSCSSHLLKQGNCHCWIVRETIFCSQLFFNYYTVLFYLKFSCSNISYKSVFSMFLCQKTLITLYRPVQDVSLILNKLRIPCIKMKKKSY